MGTGSNDLDIRQALIAEIAQAFDGVQREDGITLHQARVLDDYGTPQEQADARALDTETRWQDVPEAWIEELADTLAFMCPKGFRYYIPAFMVWALKHYDQSDSFAGDAAVYAFGAGDPTGDHIMKRTSLLTQPQKRAIANFLSYFVAIADQHVANDESARYFAADDEPARKALNEYWHQFL